MPWASMLSWLLFIHTISTVDADHSTGDRVVMETLPSAELKLRNGSKHLIAHKGQDGARHWHIGLVHLNSRAASTGNIKCGGLKNFSTKSGKVILNGFTEEYGGECWLLVLNYKAGGNKNVKLVEKLPSSKTTVP